MKIVVEVVDFVVFLYEEVLVKDLRDGLFERVFIFMFKIVEIVVEVVDIVEVLDWVDV